MHHRWEIGARRVQNLVKVIAHKRVAEALRAELLESDRNNFQKSPPIAVIREDRLFAVTSRHHVINRPGKQDSTSSPHTGLDTNGRPDAIRRKRADFGRYGPK
jgi:hypothetical protein